ncbi:hypothetical protein HOI18_01005 [Candidatus Uhrbacteria bacterium]|jgi:hypothetical protein|nr:hypothetical protein [Candidatus Uhrbacteria bacterium]
MERLVNIKLAELTPTIRALSDAGGTVDDASWIRRGGNASLLVRFIHETRKLVKTNPFEQTVELQMRRLQEQNDLGNWGISEDVLIQLSQTAPKWPEGREAYRVFKLRFGEGRDGMIQTFEAHAAAIERVHSKYWRWENVLSGNHQYQGQDVDRLRLLAGNDSHKPVVEWAIISDLSAHRSRESVADVRNSNSLADEGLTLAWLNPERVAAIDYKEWCAWFCAGYELNIPGRDSRQRVVLVDLRLHDGATRLHARWCSNTYVGASVPSVG